MPGVRDVVSIACIPQVTFGAAYVDVEHGWACVSQGPLIDNRNCMTQVVSTNRQHVETTQCSGNFVDGVPACARACPSAIPNASHNP